MKLDYWDATDLLYAFGISAPVNNIFCIQESMMRSGYRGVFCLDTAQGKWICRLSNELSYPSELTEKQSQFAMQLLLGGVNTARKLQSRGNYVIDRSCGGVIFHATMEEYLGNDLTTADLSTFREFGRILGKAHTLSQMGGLRIGYSFLSSAIKESKASFSRILNKAVPSMPDTKPISAIADLHDQLVVELSKIWIRLPLGAVQGDVGIYNNLMNTERGIGIIDFNLAGDEAYIADALSAFYSSIHKHSWQERLEFFSEGEMLQCFFEGYASQRMLEPIEVQAYPCIAALFDGLFYCKNAIELWNNGNQNIGEERISHAEKRFSPDLHPLPKCLNLGSKEGKHRDEY